MSRLSLLRCSSFAIAVALLGAPGSARAERTVAVLFTGFGATPGAAGMDELAATLDAAFGGNPAHPFSSQVFPYTGLQEAFDFIDGFADLGRVALIGHSFGADAAIELAGDYLAPAGIQVDLLIQLDSFGSGDDVLPPGVAEGFNYYQISTGLFEPQGETFVAGSTNYQVEVLYGVTNADITHTTIDCPLFDYTQSAYAALFGSQPDLYARIVDHVDALQPAAVPALGPLGIAAVVLALLSAARRRGSGGTTPIG